MAREFKIFYSWQSDLEGATTRNFISSAIDAAVKYLANTITVIPDRDTTGETGSPNIEQTIFSKIDDCDLFIADISIVGEYTDKDGNIKYNPNSNVLIELGYAVKVLGWENVICLMNTDFGKEADLPFDLNHHRVTGYSLMNSEKADIRKNLRDIISSTVITLMENRLRPKTGFASHIVGSYDFEGKIVTEKLIPFDIQNCEFAIAYKNNLLQEIRDNIDKVCNIKLVRPNKVDIQDDQGNEDVDTEKGFVEINGEKLKKGTITLDLFGFKKVEISDEVQKKLQASVKKYFDIELNDEFFYLGNLEIQTKQFMGMSSEYRGTDEEQTKYSLIIECISLFSKFWIFDMYIKTFEGMFFFPLAIWNKTTVTDKDINISIIVDNNTEVVIPDDKLIYEDIVDIAGHVYEEQFLEMLLKMPDTSDIVDGSDYEPETSIDLPSSMARYAMGPFGYSQDPEYDIDDYIEEIQKYIASPIESSSNEFNFHISKLRANEKNWIGKGILLKPKDNKIILNYRITSDHSDGSVEGIMEYEYEFGLNEKVNSSFN